MNRQESLEDTTKYKSLRKKLASGGDCPSKAAHSLFFLGYTLDKLGFSHDASLIYRETSELLESIYDKGDSTKFTLCEFASCAFRHGLNLYALGRLAEARASFSEASDKFEKVTFSSATANAATCLAQALRWLAVSQRQIGDIEQACATYKRAIALQANLLTFAPQTSNFETQRATMQALINGYDKARHLLGSDREISS